MRILAIAILSCTACYSQPATGTGTNSEETSTGEATTTATDPDDTTSEPETTSITTEVDPDTSGSTGIVECDVARFDQSNFDEACFAP
jgi:hypothetical protein